MNNIGWCDVTWNPVTGCTPVSEACQNCYARRMAKRLAGRYGYPAGDGFAVTLHPDKLAQLSRWRKPRRVFVVSMGDLFHEDVPDDFIFRVLDSATRGNRRHTYLVLTKRPARMRRWFEQNQERFWHYRQTEYTLAPWPDPCLWLGTTVENDMHYDRVVDLLATPAAVRFVSVEPMLGPVSFYEQGVLLGKKYLTVNANRKGLAHNLATGHTVHCQSYCAECFDCHKVWIDHKGGIDWVICGGETGPGARPLRPEWVRNLRDQCVAAGVPFWFKGWGGPQHAGWVIDGKLYQGCTLDGKVWEQRP